MIVVYEWVTNHMPFAPGETKVVYKEHFQIGQSKFDSKIETFTSEKDCVEWIKQKFKKHLNNDLIKLIDLATMLMEDTTTEYRATPLKTTAMIKLQACKKWLESEDQKLNEIMDVALKMKPYFDDLLPLSSNLYFNEYSFLNSHIHNQCFGFLNTLK